MYETQPNQNEIEKAQVEVAQAASQALDETLGAGTAWTLSGDVGPKRGPRLILNRGQSKKPRLDS